MASIRTEAVIEAPPHVVWSAVSDWGALHERLAPGFVIDTRLDGKDRIVTFFDGNTVREILVDMDSDARRLVWSIVGGPYSHHNGVAQVFDEAPDRTRFVWVADLLPDALAERTTEMMQRGTAVIKETLDGARADT